MKKFLALCLQVEAEKRANAKQLLQDRFIVESDDVESRVGYRHRFICLDDGLDRAVVEEMRHRKRRLASSKRRGLVRVVVIGDVATIDAVGGAD